jgi:5'-nucleotidase
LDEDEELARKVPGIDLILGGQEGGPTATPARSIYRADGNARTIYVHDLSYDRETRRLKRIQSRLEAIAQ